MGSMEKGSTINSVESRKRKPPLVPILLAMLMLVVLGTAAVYFITREPVENAAEDWITHNSPDGAFSVKLPDEPEASQREAEDGGDPIHMLTVPLRSRVYWVAWSDYTEDQIERFGSELLLDFAVDNGIQAVEGIITRRIDLTWQDHPGCEFWADLPGGKAHFRIVLVGKRMYRQAIIHAPGFQPNDDLFFGSFALNPA